MNSKILPIALLIIVSCSSCVTADGIGIGNGKPKYMNKNLVKYGRLPDRSDAFSTSDTSDKSEVSGIIAIGSVLALRRFDSESVALEYDTYRASFDAWNSSRKPSLDEGEFSSTMAGWTRIRIFDVVFASGAVNALVSTQAVDDIYFHGPVAAFLGNYGDLVAARSNADGALVINSVLCKVNTDARQRENSMDSYSKCLKQYRFGVFDASSGRQLGGKLIPKKKGSLINVETFKVIN